MASGGRGRGRGRSSLSFNTDQLGFNKGDALPPPATEPPPLYPPMQSLPTPLVKTQASLYIASRLGEQRRRFQQSAFYILTQSSDPVVERFSDKYSARKAAEITFDTAFLPEQLQPAERARARRKCNGAAKAGEMSKKLKGDDIEQKLKALEEREGSAENEETAPEDDKLKAEQKQEADDEADNEVEDEEELEEETDYVSGYFDNGESYLDEEDDNLDDGPLY